MRLGRTHRFGLAWRLRLRSPTVRCQPQDFGAKVPAVGLSSSVLQEKTILRWRTLNG